MSSSAPSACRTRISSTRPQVCRAWHRIAGGRRADSSNGMARKPPFLLSQVCCLDADVVVRQPRLFFFFFFMIGLPVVMQRPPSFVVRHSSSLMLMLMLMLMLFRHGGGAIRRQRQHRQRFSLSFGPTAGGRGVSWLTVVYTRHFRVLVPLLCGWCCWC